MSERPFVLSIVIPVYNGAESVPALLEHLAALEFGPFEIVLVNDGSPDNSLQVCRDLAARLDVPITVVDLARNFGEHNAVMAGLRLARGDYIITMDDDLQNPPEEVERLWRYASENQFDVVYTYYAAKQHSPWRNFGSWLTNYLASYLIGKPRDLYLSSFRCMAAFVAEHIVRHAGPYPYVDGLIIQTTQRIGKLQVAHLPRAAGRSNYTLRRLIRLFLSMFLNFSVIPLRIASLVGGLTAVLGIIGLVMVIVEGLNGGQPTGWPSLMAVILTISGVQLIVLGLIGEYLGRAFLTLNQKPQSIVRTIERNDAAKLD
ncbi:MAG TPA: glycosyltransferase family 2 protein [Dongiaceae bacterium]|nr:glycosyltransferase family 2 protein [Dongiaceae bacterium]